MNKEELMRPRYKVIADYPLSSLSLGSTIVPRDPMSACVVQGGAWFIDLNKYPHLFKKIEWWEERKPEEMPEYVRVNSGIVCKVITYSQENGRYWLKEFKDSPVWVEQVTPATLEEYEAQQNK